MKLQDLAFYYPLVVLEGYLFVARLESSGLVVEEATSVPVSFYYRSAQYAEEQVYTVLVVTEAAFVREIERLDTWLLEVAEYLKDNTSRFSDHQEKSKPTKRRTAAKKRSSQGTKKHG